MQNASLVRASSTEVPESYDGVTGIQSIAENNGQGIRAAFTLRNNLYFVKERSLYVTADDGVNEPALWQVAEVSNKVGTPSAHGVGYGEEWVVIAGRSGLYYFDGSAPVKLSQEIQPTWDAINWQYGQRLWVQVDTQHKRILVGVPMGQRDAAQPDSGAGLYRGPAGSAGRGARTAGTREKMGTVDYCGEFVRPDRTRERQRRRFSWAPIIQSGKFIRQSKDSCPMMARRSIRFTPLRFWRRRD